MIKKMSAYIILSLVFSISLYAILIEGLSLNGVCVVCNNYLLLETGDALLLEDGSKLILE